MLGGGADAATLVDTLGAGPPPPECRWGRRHHRGATACRLLERDDRGVDGPGVEGDSRLGESHKPNVVSNGELQFYLIVSYIFYGIARC